MGPFSIWAAKIVPNKIATVTSWVNNNTCQGLQTGANQILNGCANLTSVASYSQFYSINGSSMYYYSTKCDESCTLSTCEQVEYGAYVSQTSCIPVSSNGFKVKFYSPAAPQAYVPPPTNQNVNKVPVGENAGLLLLPRSMLLLAVVIAILALL